MSQKKVVSELPVLNQADYPELPKVPEGAILVAFESPMNKIEKETVLGILTTNAIRAKQWQPVGAASFTKMLSDLGGFALLMAQKVINSAWAMAEEGLLEILVFEEKDYLVPSPELAAMLDKSKLRVVEA